MEIIIMIIVSIMFLWIIDISKNVSKILKRLEEETNEKT